MIRSAIFAALIFAGSNLSATTSYLMVESPFGGSSTPTAYQFAVEYSGNQLLTGQDLVEAVFGAPNLSSTGGVPLNNDTYSSTNTIAGVQYAAQYTYSSGLGYYVSSFSIGGLQGGQSGVPNPSYYWGYFNAGGGYDDVTGYTAPPIGPYPSGSWSFANTGGDGRTLADQSGTGAPSFDDWVFGDGDDSQFPSVSPTVADFVGATLINLVSPTVSSNTANLAASAVSLVIQGTNFDATTPANNTVTFNLGAVGIVTAATTTSLTVGFTVQPTSTGSLTAVVTTDSISSGSPVQVATVVNSDGLGTPTLTEGNGAGTDSVLLAVTPASATWTAKANNTWLHTSASGTGSAVVTFTFDANTGATRTGTLTIAGRTLTVTQAGSTYVAANPVTALVSAGLSVPQGVALDGSGNVYFSDSGNETLQEWTAATNTVGTLVSTGLNQPRGVAVDGAGNVYIADTMNNAIKKWTAATQTVSTLVSTGLNQPGGVAADGAANVYIADTMNNAVKKWTAVTQTVSTLVSTGLSDPGGVAVDGAGNVYIADTDNNAIKKWTAATSTVSTLVSTGLNNPVAVAVDGSGNVYIADTGNNAIKKWTAATQTVSTLVSTGLINPQGVAMDGSGNVYFSDSGNEAIKELSRTFVDPTAKSESLAAGSDALPAVLPVAENLLPPFAPSSDQSWLTIGSITGDVVNFNFTANPGATRIAHITLLGQSITVTQTSVMTSPATEVSSGWATLNGEANLGGQTTVAYFQYGTSTNYGSTTATLSLGSGSSAVPVSYNINALAKGTTYHYRLVVYSGGIITYGADQTFTTPATTSPPNWHSAQVTALTSSNPMPMADGARTGVADSSLPLYFYKGSIDNNMWCVYLNGSTWTQVQLSTNANVSDWLAFGTKYNLCCYQAQDNTLWCTYLNGSQWTTVQLGNLPQGVTVAGDVVIDNAWNIIYYRGSDSNIYAVQLIGSQWVHSSLGGSANVQGSLAVDATNHLIYYLGTNNQLWCYQWTGKVWQQVQLSTTANIAGPLAVDSVGLFVYYRSSVDNTPWCDYWTGKVWSQVQLSSTSTIDSSGTTFSDLIPYPSKYIALYLDGNGQAESLDLSGSAWAHALLGDGGSSLTGGFSLQPTNHWLFARRSDGNVMLFYYQ